MFYVQPLEGGKIPHFKGVVSPPTSHQFVCFSGLSFFLCIPEDHWESGFAFGQTKGGGKMRKTPNSSM